MNKVFLDLDRYNGNKKEEYAETIHKIFKYRNIRTTDEKIELLEELETLLPVVVEGDRRKIRIKSIIRLMNNIMQKYENEVGSLYYTDKKIYLNKNGQKIYSTMYSFGFTFI